MSNHKVRVLDSREITFLVSDDILEVYDQNDNLVGERKLPFSIPSHVEEQDVFDYAQSKGVDINELINLIVDEAVFENHDYDILLEDDQMTLFSPSANQYIVEPYKGIFAWLEQVLTKDKPQEQIERQNDRDDKETIYVEEGAEGENQPNKEYSDEPEEENTDNKNNQEDNPSEPSIPETQSQQTHVQSKQPTQEFANQKPEPQVQHSVKVVQSEPQNPMPNISVSNDANKDIVKVWANAYKSVLTNSTEKGNHLKSLKDSASVIILQSLEEGKNIFELNETMVAFELMNKEPEKFGTVTMLEIVDIVRAGLYQAYMLKTLA